MNSKRSNLSLLFLIVGILVLGFALEAQSAHAYTPTIANVSDGVWVAGTTYTFSLTVTAGDTVAVFTSVRNAGNNSFLTTSVSTPGVSGGFTQVQIAQLICAYGTCGSNFQLASYEQLWTGIATGTGSTLITVTVGSAGITSGSAQAYDNQYVGAPTLNSGFCNENTVVDCGNPISGAPVSTTGTALYEMGVATLSAVNSASGGCTFVNAGDADSASSYQTVTVYPSPPCGVNYTTPGAGQGYAQISAQFVLGSSVGTFTTTVNQDCVGSCSNTHTTGSYLLTNYAYLYYGEAVPGAPLGETLYNFTSYITAAHLSTTSGVFYMAFYTGNSGNAPPSATSPLSLLWSTSVTIANNTVPEYLHTTPNANVGAGDWYAIVIMATSTASRGSGASGSGIAIAQTAAPLTMYDLNIGFTTLPPTLYANNITTPNLYMIGLLKFGSVIVTTTITSTLSGIITSTVLVTSTISILASADNIVSLLPNFPELLLILITPLGLFIGLGALTKSGAAMLIMTVCGLAIDVALGTLLGLLPFYFVLVMILLMVLALVIALISMNGGGSAG